MGLLLGRWALGSGEENRDPLGVTHEKAVGSATFTLFGGDAGSTDPLGHRGDLPAVF